VFEIDLGGDAEQWKNALVSLTVESGLAPFVDVAVLHFAPGADAPEVATGDTGTIALGYEDSAVELAFSGRAQTVRHALSGPRKVIAVNGASVLSGLRVNQSYEQQTAGDIVKDLASRAGVNVARVEDGVDFPFHVVDDRRNVWRHLAELARKSGYLAHMTTEDELHFAPLATGETVQTFKYAADVLALDVEDDTGLVGKVRTVGEGAASSQGADAWPWFVKDPSPLRGEAGSGDNERVIVDPSLRSTDAIRQAAGSIAQAARFLRLTGRLLTAGAPAVKVGATIEIADAPDAALNGKCLVRWLRHSYSKQKGFTTLMYFSHTEGAGGGLLGGLVGSLGGVL